MIDPNESEGDLLLGHATEGGGGHRTNNSYPRTSPALTDEQQNSYSNESDP
jgi:hypothetical protein